MKGQLTSIESKLFLALLVHITLVLSESVKLRNGEFIMMKQLLFTITGTLFSSI